MCQNGVINANEWRALEELDPISAAAGGDTYIVNTAAQPRRNRRAGRQRPVRVSGCPRPPRRRDGHARRLTAIDPTALLVVAYVQDAHKKELLAAKVDLAPAVAGYHVVIIPVIMTVWLTLTILEA